MNWFHTAQNHLNQTLDMELKAKKEVDFIILSDILIVRTCILVPMVILPLSSLCSRTNWNIPPLSSLRSRTHEEVGSLKQKSIGSADPLILFCNFGYCRFFGVVVEAC